MGGIVKSVEALGRRMNRPGIEERLDRVRAMLLEGRTIREIRNITATSPGMVTKIRRTLGEIRCGCGRSATHPGTCTFRTSKNRIRDTGDLAVDLASATPRCRRFLAKRPELKAAIEHIQDVYPANSPQRAILARFLNIGFLSRRDCEAVLDGHAVARIRAEEIAAGIGKQYAGAVGFRLYNLKLKVIDFVETKRRPSGIVSFIARLVDEGGNLFQWNGCRKICPAAGTSYLLDGTVMAHEECLGQRVTVLTKCQPSTDTVAIEREITDPDHLLMQRISRGGAEAFRALLRKYQGLAIHIALGILHCHADAEDAAQRVFVKIWNLAAAGKYHYQGKFTSWLAVITRFEALHELRRRRSEPTVSMELCMEDSNWEPRAEEADVE